LLRELPCAKSTGRRDAPQKIYGDSSLRQRPQGVLAFNINSVTEKGGNRTPGSKREYIEIMRVRYLKADKKEKGKILDEFIKVIGYHRKAAIRVMIKKVKSGVSHKGRPTK